MYIPDRIKIVWHGDDIHHFYDVTSADTGREHEPVADVWKVEIKLTPSKPISAVVTFNREVDRDRDENHLVTYTGENLILDVQHNFPVAKGE